MKTHTRLPRFDRQWEATIAIYENETDRRLLTSAIKDYQLNGTEPQLPPALMVAFEFLRPTIDRRARNRARRLARLASAQSTTSPATTVDLPVDPTSTPQNPPSSPTTAPKTTPKTAVGATGRSTASLSIPLDPSAPLSPSTPPSSIPDESDMAKRFSFWNEFARAHPNPLYQKEIDADRPDFETDLWEHEDTDSVPDRPDGSPMPHDELVAHYCRIIRNDRRLLTRISDEIVRLAGVLYRTTDLLDFIDRFSEHAKTHPIINLNRANCRRAFIRYMLSQATRYRAAIRR